MMSLKNILDALSKQGISVSEMTFWRYVEAGVVPPGEKVPGRGNRRYWSDDVVERVACATWLAHLSKLPFGTVAVEFCGEGRTRYQAIAEALRRLNGGDLPSRNDQPK
jgi:hypothetical protein